MVTREGPVRGSPLAAVLLAALAGCSGAPRPGPPAPAVSSAYDLVIRNGRVLDGAGNPWIRADVAIKNGRFATIGRVPGNWADVTVFDLDALEDRATYDDPTRPPTGIALVLVNGMVTIENGKHTGARAGKVLIRCPSARRASSYTLITACTK